MPDASSRINASAHHNSYLHDGQEDRKCQNAPSQWPAVSPHNDCPESNANSRNETDHKGSDECSFIRTMEMRAVQLSLVAPGRVIQ